MATITIEFDPNALQGYTDAHLAMLWQVTQYNPEDGFASEEPGDLAQRVGWEILRRWLRTVQPEMYHHQHRHYWQHQLRRFARHENGEWVPKGPAGGDLDP